MKDFIQKNFKGDPIIWIVLLLLIAVSTLEMYSASTQISRENYNSEIWRHFVFLATGFCIIFAIHRNIHYKYFAKIGILLYPLAILALLLLIIAGKFINQPSGNLEIISGVLSVVKVNYAVRWMEVAGIQFQPSEIAKFSVVIVMAYILSKNQKKDESNKKAFIPAFIMLLIPCALIFKENWSTSIILLVVGFCMMLLGRVSTKQLSWMAGVAIVFLSVFLVRAWNKADEPYSPKSKTEQTQNITDRAGTWDNRIVSYIRFKRAKLDDTFKVNDDNRQMVQAKIAIANSRFFGVGPGKRVQSRTLPLAYSDFIYVVIIEELGFIGGFIVMMLYFILLFRAGVLANKCLSAFPVLLVLGSTCMIVMPALVNMAVAVGLFPITGQPLPMISHGGTSIIVTSLYFGMILSVSKHIKEEEEQIKVQTKENQTVTS